MRRVRYFLTQDTLVKSGFDFHAKPGLILGGTEIAVLGGDHLRAICTFLYDTDGEFQFEIPIGIIEERHYEEREVSRRLFMMNGLPLMDSDEGVVGLTGENKQ